MADTYAGPHLVDQETVAGIDVSVFSLAPTTVVDGVTTPGSATDLLGMFKNISVEFGVETFDTTGSNSRRRSKRVLRDTFGAVSLDGFVRGVSDLQALWAQEGKVVLVTYTETNPATGEAGDAIRGLVMLEKYNKKVGEKETMDSLSGTTVGAWQRSSDGGTTWTDIPV